MTRKPRLLYYLDCPCAGGANLLILYLIRETELSQSWDVSVVFRHNPPLLPLLDRLIPKSVPRVSVPFPERVELVDRLDGAFASGAARRLGRVLLRALEYLLLPFEFALLWLVFRARRPDIVHINNGGYPGAAGCRAAALAARAAGAQVLMNVHNVARPKSPLDMPPDGAVDACVDAYVTASIQAREALVRRGFPAGKVSSVPNGVPTPAVRGAAAVRRELGLSADDVVWAVVGWFEPRKGQAVLVEALRRLEDAGELPPRLRVLFVGDGPELSPVRDAARALGPAARFLGYRGDASDILNCADGLIIPSLHSEDMPLIVQDAMALGKPVIGSALGGIAEEVDDARTGLLVPPGDAAALARAVLALSLDPRRRAELGRAGRARFEELFDISRTAPLYASIYRDLATKGAEACLKTEAA